MKAWLEHSLHSLGLAVRRLREAPLASLFSILVIGVALSLPAGLYAVLVNLDRLAGGVDTRPQVTLFLKLELAEADGRKLADGLAGRSEFGRVRFVARDESLRRLKEGGLADIAAGLDNNPLPDTILLTTRQDGQAALERLAADLRKRPEVDHLVMDSDWAKRLAALLDFGRNLVWMLASLLGLALAAITGNTIRRQIATLRDEIEVSRLIGATDRFIRRPFLYFGALQGLLGGLAGWAIVAGCMVLLRRHLEPLATAWGMRFDLAGLAPLDTLVLLAVSVSLGLLGAYLAVNHSLRRLAI
jgi:cell division transport system permease protein